MKYAFSDQRGAMLVLTAFLLPFIIAFTGLAVDFGSAYVRRSQLQNAADASVLAGAYHLSDQQTNSIIESYLDTNLTGFFTDFVYQRSDAYPSNPRTIYYQTDQQQDELGLVLRCSVDTVFLRFFDINAIPVSVMARAQAAENGVRVNDDMFNYAFTAAHIPAKDYNADASAESPTKDYSIWFHTDNVKVMGNILTNGKITFDRNYNTMLNGTLYAADTVRNGLTGAIPNEHIDYPHNKKFYPDVWGCYGWSSRTNFEEFVDSLGPRWRWLKVILQALIWFFGTDSTVNYYAFVAADTSGFFTKEVHNRDRSLYWDETITGKKRVDYQTHATPVDIAIDKNPGIQSLLRKYDGMSADERVQGHIYYNVNPADQWYTLWLSKDLGYPGFTTDGKNSYKVIVVYNTIQLSPIDYGALADDQYAVVISLHGNIELHQNGEFNGILYAPEGNIKIDGNGLFEGSAVAQQILITQTGQEIEAKNFFASDPELPGTKERQVKLIQ